MVPELRFGVGSLKRNSYESSTLNKGDCSYRSTMAIIIDTHFNNVCCKFKYYKCSNRCYIQNRTDIEITY